MNRATLTLADLLEYANSIWQTSPVNTPLAKLIREYVAYVEGDTPLKELGRVWMETAEKVVALTGGT